MGAHSTLRITRSKAKSYIVDKVMNGLSDKELEDIMDAMLYDKLYNCMIVADEYGRSETNMENDENDDNVI